jgi:metacaspase-1
MQKFLAVGLNHYLRAGNDLNECVADAHDMGAFFARLHGVSPETLLNLDATKANALRILKQYVQEALEGKLSYIGFSWSGHGTHYSRPEEEDGLGEALVCYDIAEKNGEWDPATIIKDEELRSILNMTPPTCIVEGWLDTCYSGGMDRGFRVARNRFMHAPDNTHRSLRISNSTITLGLNPNIILWCAASEGQEAADSPELGNGAFTFAWLNAFRQDPYATRTEILLATRRLIAGEYEQTPRLKCWNKQAQRSAGDV